MIQVVPEADCQMAEARIHRSHFELIRRGQAIGVRFAAFKQRDTLDINGTLTRIAGDLIREAVDRYRPLSRLVAASDAEMRWQASL